MSNTLFPGIIIGITVTLLGDFLLRSLEDMLGRGKQLHTSVVSFPYISHQPAFLNKIGQKIEDEQILMQTTISEMLEPANSNWITDASPAVTSTPDAHIEDADSSHEWNTQTSLSRLRELELELITSYQRLISSLTLLEREEFSSLIQISITNEGSERVDDVTLSASRWSAYLLNNTYHTNLDNRSGDVIVEIGSIPQGDTVTVFAWSKFSYYP